jgi:hypothetical protein
LTSRRLKASQEELWHKQSAAVSITAFTGGSAKLTGLCKDETSATVWAVVLPTNYHLQLTLHFAWSTRHVHADGARRCLWTAAIQVIYENGGPRWNDTDRKNRRTHREPCHSATLSTTNPTWTDPGTNSGLRGERPTTNRLSHGTAKNTSHHRGGNWTTNQFSDTYISKNLKENPQPLKWPTH